jgi:hypothetical protein
MPALVAAELVDGGDGWCQRHSTEATVCSETRYARRARAPGPPGLRGCRQAIRLAPNSDYDALVLAQFPELPFIVFVRTDAGADLTDQHADRRSVDGFVG